MGANTGIQWTHTPRADGTMAPGFTFNGWEGCQRVSDGCTNCYAETRNARFHAKPTGGATHWGPTAPRLMRSESYWKQPLKWNRDAKREGVRARVFCASLSDVFEDRPDLIEPRARLFRLIEECDSLDFLLLTKRPENMRRLASVWGDEWPSNVWAGCTVEHQEAAEKRILWLCEVPAKVRFLSCEPLLERVDLRSIDMGRALGRVPLQHDPTVTLDALTGHMKGPDDMTDLRVHWVIVGGESGREARPFEIEWARRVIDDCKATGVPVFCKQMGAAPMISADHLSDCRLPDFEWPVGTVFTSAERYRDATYLGRHVKLDDSHGGDWSEWPDAFKVREFPEVAR